MKTTVTFHSQENVIKTLAKNKNIVIMKQDKGSGVVIMDKSKYIEKFLQHLDTPNFTKLSTDITKSIESKVQRTLLKIKNKVDKSTYEKIYPSGSNPGRFCGTAKINKLEPKR